MKEVIIVSHDLEIGGAERALLNLLYSIDYTKYKVDLFLYRHQGEWISQLPEEVKLLPEKKGYASLAVPIKDLIRNKQIRVLKGRIIGKLKAVAYNKKHKMPYSEVGLEYSHKYTVKYMPEITNHHYDLAISFNTPHYFVINRVSANKYAAWIHTDYSTISFDMSSELAMWSKYDYIVSISESCTKSFLNVFPSLNEKVILIENIFSIDAVNKLANAFYAGNDMHYSNNETRLLSVGRFSEAKNFENIPEICSRLIDMGCNVKWYIIGYGGFEKLIKENIAKYKVERNVIMLGKKDNPYPYIAACDVYIQPSRYEGKAVTVREAQMLGKPVIITAYATAASQLDHGKDGIVVPMDTKECALGIASILKNPEMLKKIADYCTQNDYSNTGEVEKVYQMAEGAI